MEDIYDPLNDFASKFRAQFEKVMRETFQELVDDAGTDIKANKKTVAELRSREEELESVESWLSFWQFVRVVFWLVAIGGLAFPLIVGFAHDWQFSRLSQELVLALFLAPAAGTFVLALIFIFLNSKIKKYKAQKALLEKLARELKALAWEQMKVLNSLYDWDITQRMISKTVPRLEFDPFFTHQRVLDLKQIYDWDDHFNDSRSVIFANSGLINGNPFVFCKTRKMQWGKKTYTGTKTIRWTTTERGSDGKWRTVSHSQTLVAEVEAPFPEYFTGTRLIYGNTAAPDLTFLRKKSGYADGGIGAWFKKRELKKFSRNLKDDSEYTMMQNEEFEVAFDTKNRNNERQFRLLFTPLAQRSMLALLRDKIHGYGDDFNFEKVRKINVITADHLSELQLETNPSRYRHYEFAVAQKTFFEYNRDYFRSIYFAFAPLLCVPMYQQVRSREDIYGAEWANRASFWEHESLANFWGQKHFEHPSCVTNCILKTEEIARGNGESLVKVYAHGYRKEQRLTYVEKWGLDGRVHNVPVYWDEYLPVCGTGTFNASEDANASKKAFKPNERAQYIAEKIRECASGGNAIYRRSMITKL